MGMYAKNWTKEDLADQIETHDGTVPVGFLPSSTAGLSPDDAAVIVWKNQGYLKPTDVDSLETAVEIVSDQKRWLDQKEKNLIRGIPTKAIAQALYKRVASGTIDVPSAYQKKQEALMRKNVALANMVFEGLSLLHADIPQFGLWNLVTEKIKEFSDNLATQEEAKDIAENYDEIHRLLRVRLDNPKFYAEKYGY